MAAAAILNLLPSLFLAHRRIWIVVLYVHVKFRKSNSTMVAELLSSVKNSKWRLSATLVVSKILSIESFANLA